MGNLTHKAIAFYVVNIDYCYILQQELCFTIWPSKLGKSLTFWPPDRNKTLSASWGPTDSIMFLLVFLVRRFPYMNHRNIAFNCKKLYVFRFLWIQYHLDLYYTIKSSFHIPCKLVSYTWSRCFWFSCHFFSRTCGISFSFWMAH